MKFWPYFVHFLSDVDKICAVKNVYLLRVGFTKIRLVNGMI